MKKFSCHILLATGILLGCSGMEAFGQDVGTPSFENYDTEPLRVKEKVILSPGDPENNRSASPAPIVKDSAAIRFPQRNVYKPSSVVPKKGTKPAEKAESDDSLLSFNFLYYLIQKYKMQDIIE